MKKYTFTARFKNNDNGVTTMDINSPSAGNAYEAALTAEFETGFEFLSMDLPFDWILDNAEQVEVTN